MQPGTLKTARARFLLTFALAGQLSAFAGDQPVNTWQQRVEEDWVLSEKVALLGAGRGPVTTALDAAGGCDGVKNGEWGFHTGESKEPWWQVDLGKLQPVSEVRIWNRGAAAERAWHMRLLFSDDDKDFHQVYQHDGSAFYGFSDGKPLVIKVNDPRP